MSVPASSCSPKPYAYAGLVSDAPARGIEAVVTTTAVAKVISGHVAAWIGVGSTSAGPGGQAEWLQTGVNTQAGTGSQLYAEITQPGRPIKYLTLASGIAPGASYHLAVVEIPGKTRCLARARERQARDRPDQPAGKQWFSADGDE